MCINSQCFKLKLEQLLQQDEGKAKKINILFTSNDHDELIVSPAIASSLSIGIEEA